MEFIKSFFLKFQGDITRYFTGIIAIYFSLSLFSCNPTEKVTVERSYGNMADTLEKSLQEEIINVWYPRIIDSTYGGYLTNFSYDWKQLPHQEKSIVYTARHVWTTSMLYQQYPEREEFLKYAEQGFDFMKKYLWDDTFGGYFIIVGQDGSQIDSLNNEKRIYGQAFAIYGLAQYYEVTRNEDVLEWAKKSFQWIEEKAHDPVNGGYYENLLRQGAPQLSADTFKIPLNDRLMSGYKDFNSSIHILEALTTLYHVWPDELVRERLEEMFHVVRDTMVTEPGYLQLYFRPDWTHVTGSMQEGDNRRNSWFFDHVTFGHDIETAYLLYEAAEALEMYDEETASICKMLVDHTIRKGWDEKNGGFFERGLYVTPDSLRIIDDHKSWWSQVEALNSLLLMHALYPEDDTDYYTYFLRQWLYIDKYLIDHTYGGWYGGGLDTNPEIKTAPKAHNWKTAYHNGRGMVNCVNLLRSLQIKEPGSAF
jgi:mannobiose 2-epimerase